MLPDDLFDVAREAGYPVDAFLFLQRGLEFTVCREHGEEPDDEEELLLDQTQQQRHVGGRTLCYGLRDFATQEYGLLARTVLRRWNIHRCEDFGRIVFAMIDAGLMSQNDDDHLDDFNGVFDFAEAFGSDLSLAQKR